MDIYIYYRVEAVEAERLQAQVAAMQLQLSEQWSVQTSLKCRGEQDQGAGTTQTWMEIYQDVPQGFLPALQSAVEGADILQSISGERHVETFVDMLACA